MKKSIIITLLTCSILFLATAAFASDARVWIAHRTDSAIVGGKATFDNVWFSWLYLGVKDAGKSGSGTMTVKNGNYHFGTWAERWEKDGGTKVDGADREFKLSYLRGMTGEGFSPVDAKGKEMIFWGAADAGLSRKRISYKIGSAEAEVTLPKIRSVRDQMNAYVPYMEYVLSGGKITKLIIRAVKPDVPDVALTRDDATDFRLLQMVRFFGKSPKWTFLKEIKINQFFRTGDVIQAEVDVNPPIDPASVGVVEVWYQNSEREKGSEVFYRWNFYQN